MDENKNDNSQSDLIYLFIIFILIAIAICILYLNPTEKDRTAKANLINNKAISAKKENNNINNEDISARNKSESIYDAEIFIRNKNDNTYNEENLIRNKNDNTYNEEILIRNKNENVNNNKYPRKKIDENIKYTEISIRNKDEYIDFINNCNLYNNYENVIINLMTDIDFKGSENNHTPIFKHEFKGIFNGNGHTFKNVYIEDDSGAALFSENSGIIEKLTITGIVKGKYSAAAFVDKNNGSIIQCVNYAEIHGGYQVGGICSWERRLENLWHNRLLCKLWRYY